MKLCLSKTCCCGWSDSGEQMTARQFNYYNVNEASESRRTRFTNNKRENKMEMAIDWFAILTMQLKSGFRAQKFWICSRFPWFVVVCDLWSVMEIVGCLSLCEHQIIGEFCQFVCSLDVNTWQPIHDEPNDEPNSSNGEREFLPQMVAKLRVPQREHLIHGLCHQPRTKMKILCKNLEK